MSIFYQLTLIVVSEFFFYLMQLSFLAVDNTVRHDPKLLHFCSCVNKMMRRIFGVQEWTFDICML